MSGADREDRAIDAWCAVVARVEQRVVTVFERPDREAPSQGGCDAIVDRGGVRYAVEHTSLDSYERRREDDDRYRKVIQPVAEAIESEFNDSWVEMEVPAHAIPTGQNWHALRDTLTGRCRAALAGMPIADYHDLSRTRFDWLDIPFPVWISRQGLAENENSRCIIFRQTPVDLADQLAGDVRRALDEKATQLQAYKQTNYPTVLLLDFNDIVLLNRDSVAQAFARAALGWPGASTIDEVFLVDSGRRPPWVYPVKLDGRIYPDLPEFRQYFSAQFQVNYPGV